MEITTEILPKREPLPVPKRVKHPSMANWRNQDTSNWANQGAKPKGQIFLKVQYEGEVFEVSVLNGSLYSLCALRSRIKTHFDIAKFRLEFTNGEGQVESVTSQVDFEKAVKSGEKTGVVIFQVVIKADNVEESWTVNRVSYSSMASRQMMEEVVQGKKPSGQIQLNVEYNGQVMEVAVLRPTCYTLCALRSRIKTKFGLDYVSLKYVEKDNTLSAVDSQAAFEKAISKGEENTAVNFRIVDKIEKKQEKLSPQRVEHPTMVSWNKANIATHSALQGKKPSGQILLKMMHEGRLMEVSVMENTTYTLRALKSQVRTKFSLTEFNLEYLDEEKDVISVDTQVEFEKAVKMGEKSGSVSFQVIDKMEDKDKMRPSWSSKALARQAAQGKCPAGQIKMKFEFEVKAMEISVRKDTTYTLKALQSKIKSKLGFSNFVLKYFDGEKSMSVDSQDDFEEALKVGEKQGNVNFLISAELPESPEEFVEAVQGQQ